MALDDAAVGEKGLGNIKWAGKMYKSWMEPADLRGVPCAFIVNRNGKIAWIGHPNVIADEKAVLGKHH